MTVSGGRLNHFAVLRAHTTREQENIAGLRLVYGQRSETARAGVSYRPGTAFSAVGGFRNALRIAISLYETDEIIEGLRRLAAALDAGSA